MSTIESEQTAQNDPFDASDDNSSDSDSVISDPFDLEHLLDDRSAKDDDDTSSVKSDPFDLEHLLDDPEANDSVSDDSSSTLSSIGEQRHTRRVPDQFKVIAQLMGPEVDPEAVLNRAIEQGFSNTSLRSVQSLLAGAELGYGRVALFSDTNEAQAFLQTLRDGTRSFVRVKSVSAGEVRTQHFAAEQKSSGSSSDAAGLTLTDPTGEQTSKLPESRGGDTLVEIVPLTLPDQFALPKSSQDFVINEQTLNVRKKWELLKAMEVSNLPRLDNMKKGDLQVFADAVLSTWNDMKAGIAPVGTHLIGPSQVNDKSGNASDLAATLAGMAKPRRTISELERLILEKRNVRLSQVRTPNHLIELIKSIGLSDGRAAVFSNVESATEFMNDTQQGTRFVVQFLSNTRGTRTLGIHNVDSEHLLVEDYVRGDIEQTFDARSVEADAVLVVPVTKLGFLPDLPAGQVFLNQKDLSAAEKRQLKRAGVSFSLIRQTVAGRLLGTRAWFARRFGFERTRDTTSRGTGVPLTETQRLQEQLEHLRDENARLQDANAMCR